MIDKISCLCLDKREDLWTDLAVDVNNVTGKTMETFVCGNGQDPNLKYDHIDVTTPPSQFLYGSQETILNHYNAFLCHKKMIQRAIDEGRNNLLILEDDSYFINDRRELFEKANEFSNKENWDILYMGWWMKRTGYTSEDREDLEAKWDADRSWGIEPVPRMPYLQHEICGLHGCLINGPFMKHLAVAKTGPLDSLIARSLNNVRAYFLWPKLIHVKSTWSYCEKSFTKRANI